MRALTQGHAAVLTSRSVIGRDLEQDFRDRLTALRSETEQESEALLQQVEAERSALREELQLLRVQEAELQEELHSAVQVCCVLLIHSFESNSFSFNIGVTSMSQSQLTEAVGQ